MRIENLGKLTGELTVFGGPYSNVQALDAVLAAARGTLICTGDLVAYCGAPREVVAKTRAAGVHVVAGNCEKQLAARALDCGCGFEDGTPCDLLSAKWYAFANAAVDDADRDWMGGLPDILIFTHLGQQYAVIHGGVTDVARFIWRVSESDIFAEEINTIKGLCGDIDVVLAGHSGIAFDCRVGSRRWINAGVIGMPPHDGTPQTEFLRIAENGAISFETLSYDVDAAVADMTKAGLTQGYHKALQTGIWPSEDVLPVALRR